MKKIGFIFVGIILIITLIYLGLGRDRKDELPLYEASLYSWKLEDISEDKDKFYKTLKDYNIRILYQDFTKDYLEEKNDEFIEALNSRGIEVYHLGGDPSWGRTNGYSKIRSEMKRVVEFNEEVTNKIKGVVLDIEPYVSEKEEKLQKEDFKIYVEQIEKSYAYCQRHGLELIVAIPYWFDTIDEDLLERVIENSDGVSVMNYKIDKTSKNIETEVALANKYNKKIESIYEVNYRKEGYFSSHRDILIDFKRLIEENPSEKLMLSYHHYASIID